MTGQQYNCTTIQLAAWKTLNAWIDTSNIQGLTLSFINSYTKCWFYKKVLHLLNWKGKSEGMIGILEVKTVSLAPQPIRIVHSIRNFFNFVIWSLVLLHSLGGFKFRNKIIRTLIIFNVKLCGGVPKGIKEFKNSVGIHCFILIYDRVNWVVELRWCVNLGNNESIDFINLLICWRQNSPFLKPI